MEAVQEIRYLVFRPPCLLTIDLVAEVLSGIGYEAALASIAILAGQGIHIPHLLVSYMAERFDFFISGV